MKHFLNCSLLLMLAACASRTIVDLSPKYEPEKLIIPQDWKGNSPFQRASPASIPQGEWWKIFHDTTLNRLEGAMYERNPTLQASAERFIQARYEMAKARSVYFPHIGSDGNYYRHQRSMDDLLNGQVSEFAPNNTSSFAGIVSWEPDIWGRFRNVTTIRAFEAEASAADYGAVRLMLQAELASQYFSLRGLDAKIEVYRQSIDFFQQALDLVVVRFKGNLASKVDVARATYILKKTQALKLNAEQERQVTEHAIAALVNVAASAFTINPAPLFHVPQIVIPDVLPSTFLERRPDIAALERQMAVANKSIGIKRAAFFPLLNLSSRDTIFLLSQVTDVVWAVGSLVDWQLFQAGFRRANLKKSWARYRETLNLYRAGVLNAFREVENGFSKTSLMTQELNRQKEAVAAALEAQNLTMKLFQGNLSSSLALLYTQIFTLEARIREVEIRRDLMIATVYLMKALGGSWDQSLLPKDAEIPPFQLFQYTKLDEIPPAGHIGQSTPGAFVDLIDQENHEKNH